MSPSTSNIKASDKSFTLQNGFQAEDKAWSFTIPHLPSDSTSDAKGHLKSISLVSEHSKQAMTLRYEKYTPNRAIDSRSLNKYLSISFEKFRLQYSTSSSSSDTPDQEFQPAPAKESTDYIVRLLRSGIHLNGTSYHFYGHSNSQLKSKTCFLFAGTAEEAAQKIESLADFPRKSVAKSSKRVGLLFSAARFAANLPSDRYEDIADVRKDDYIFTDGCGLISTHFAKVLVQRTDLRFRNQRYTPSVFQIRYKGYKGVLTLSPELRGKIMVKFRESMRKFTGCDDPSFSVVEHSKPYGFGFLNDEVTLLLYGLGVSESILARKQREYIEFLRSVPSDSRAAFRFFSYIDEPKLAERVLMDGLDSIKSTAQSRVSSEVSKLLNKRGEHRSRILIPQSRLLFGVCDPFGVLREGECSVRVTSDGDGVPKTVVGIEVLVTRNPCLHPGDLQKFKAVQHDSLSHLIDCIVFPTRGRRPSADLMSGGDLDGDKFFVTWDQELIPSKISQAASYQGAKEPISFNPVTHDDRLVYFAKYTNASLGRVKNLYLDWARLKGPMSAECQELNHLFSQCVDGNRIKVPKHLEDPPRPQHSASPFILDVLRDLAGTYPSVHVAAQMVDVSYDRLQLLLSRDDVAFSEFELLQMTMRWCTKHRCSMEDFLEYFDFSKLTDEQKGWIVAQSTPSRNIPDLVMNGLQQSTILTKAELEYFRLDHYGLRWKKVFDSSSDRLGRFMDVMSRTLELFHRKFIVLKITNRLTIAMYIPKPLAKHQECVVHDTVRLFSFPHSQEDMATYRRSLPTLVNYRLYYDDTGLQLYRTQRRDTWIFINRPGIDDSSFRSIEDQGDKRRVRHATVEAGVNSNLIISIALGKFSGNLAKHMGRVNRTPIIDAEIYVISNRDTNSMRVLDKWLDFIDTREIMPLFEKQDNSYRLADMKDIDWGNEPDYLRRIAKDADMTVLDDLVQMATTENCRASQPLRDTSTGRSRRKRREDGKPHARLNAHNSPNHQDTQVAGSSDAPQNAGKSTGCSPTYQQAPAANTDKISKIITWLHHFNQKVRLREVYQYLLQYIASGSSSIATTFLLGKQIAFLQQAPHLVVKFIELGPWDHLSTPVQSLLNERLPDMLEAFCLVANETQVFVVEPFRIFISQITHMSLLVFGSLARYISLTVRSPETALDLLMGVLELQSSRLLIGRPRLIKYFVSNLIGIAMEHIEEAQDSRAIRDDELQLKFENGPGMANSRLRIDSHSRVRFAVNDHVQLTAASVPLNSLETRPYSMDALVERAEPGNTLFQCLHPLPPFLEECAWKAKNCGSFVTSQAMFEALENFVANPEAHCSIHDRLMGFVTANILLPSAAGGHSFIATGSTPVNYEDPQTVGDLRHPVLHSDSLIESSSQHPAEPPNSLEPSKHLTSDTGYDCVKDGVDGVWPPKRDDLNDSQNDALRAVLESPLTCLWGPPGTGKTHTVAVILEELLKDPESRILVTAPTHNAVDNVMRKFLHNMQIRKTFSGAAVRVSTDVRKVAEDLRTHTCDAMMGKDLIDNPAGRRKAQKRIKECRLIFTTCIGAALGFLRSEVFDTVIIDEASQQTEPQSLVPLTKGCSKAILVGDHVQLRATVQQHAQLVGFDVSMFERLYSSNDDDTRLRKVMLDTQYRMQASVCQFSSTEFYEGRLKTAVQDSDRPLRPKEFPWPEIQPGKLERIYFIQCSSTEDLGQRSKSNQGQAALCRQICKALQQPPAHSSNPSHGLPSIAVLAPYTRQVDTLKDLQSSNVVASSIDGFQGREADIVVYCTTRCNVHADIGFLKDLRRLNVVLTRARCACIVIGDRATLTGGDANETATGVWKRLVEAMTVMEWVSD
ncbi:MAG: hypothetical protein Q9181_003829 [Wetmoreana brouardii]